MVRKTKAGLNLGAMLDEVNIGSVEKIEKETDDKRIEKIKKCYVLTEREVEMLMMLKTKVYKRLDLSEIMGMGIKMLHDKEFGE